MATRVREPEITIPKVDADFFALVGGLDKKTPRIALKPGRARVANNYIGVMGGGYRRIGGYERYDGRAKPSYQTYDVIYATTTFSGGGLAVGSTINGQTSGATAEVIEIGATPNYLAVTRITGTFTTSENIRIGGTVIGVASATATLTETSAVVNRLQALTEAEYRTSISTVPGEGAVRGVVELEGTLYAFRNKVGGATCGIYKEHASTGWTEVVPGHTLDFNTGTVAISEGDAIDDNAGTTATVKRVVVQSGSWGAGTAAGYMVITTPSGGAWTVGEQIRVGGVQRATAAAAGSAAITLSPGGRYEFVVYNFGGSLDSIRIYGCDGVNKAFEFDGTVYAPIRTSMTTDTPKHIAAHKNRLALSFVASLQMSAALDPFSWTLLTGANQIAVGDEITGFATVPGGDTSGALMIFARDRIKILYGSSTSDWNQVDFADKIGAAHYSIAKAGNTPIFMDELGLTTARQAQEYGGFKSSVISDQIEDLVKGRSEDIVACMASRLQSVYYLFFNDASGIAVTFGAKGVEALMNFTLEVQPYCCWETNRNGGEMFIGCDDGYVYQMERGRSFDGETITAWLGLAFNHSNSPAVIKTYRMAVVEARADSGFNLYSTAQFSYDDPNLSSSYIERIETTLLAGSATGAIWEDSSWDASFYDGGDAQSLTVPLRGSGINMALAFYSEAADELPHELQGVTLHYVPRRRWRGR